MSNLLDSTAGSDVDRRRFRTENVKWAIAATAAAVAVDVYGVYGDPSPRPNQKSGLPFVLLVAVVAAVVVFGAVVPRMLEGRPRGRADAKPGLVLSIVGLILVPMAFWSGIPLVLGAGGWLVGSVARRTAGSSDTSTRGATAAVTLGVLAVFLTLVMVVLGNTVLSS